MSKKNIFRIAMTFRLGVIHSPLLLPLDIIFNKRALVFFELHYCLLFIARFYESIYCVAKLLKRIFLFRYEGICVYQEVGVGCFFIVVDNTIMIFQEVGILKSVILDTMVGGINHTCGFEILKDSGLWQFCFRKFKFQLDVCSFFISYICVCVKVF